MDITAGTNRLDKASSDFIDFLLLVFHALSKGLDLSERQHHSDKILLDAILLVG